MALTPKDCSFKTKSRRISRREWAKKSKVAMRREETAVKMFETARLKMEARDDLSVGSRETVQLLKPSCHLTEACWKSFRGHVCSVEGWSTKRRVATEEEKKKHGETRKGRVYFVDVIYLPRQNNERESSYKERNKENMNPDNQKQLEDKSKAGPSLSPPPVSSSVQNSKFFKRLSSTLSPVSSAESSESATVSFSPDPLYSSVSSDQSPPSVSPSVKSSKFFKRLSCTLSPDSPESSTVSFSPTLLDSTVSFSLAPAAHSTPLNYSVLSDRSPPSVSPSVQNSKFFRRLSCIQSPPYVSPSVKSSTFFKRLSCTLSPDSPVSSTVSISPAPLFSSV